ncbi:MAG: phosphoribosylformylglycinamidine synthase, partial [Clostridiales Family XIII bacterium]|nr:phosphoribosylformylglycinamidine synthase [Clostridiales Family XIII bacterium]
MVRRIYVEKKRGFDVEARALQRAVTENLHLTGVSGLRIINRYDVENIDDATYEAAKTHVFSEPTVDVVYEAEPPLKAGSHLFGVEYLPGQYDQRADSALQCIRLIKTDARPTVRFARMVILEGVLEEEALKAVKRFVINPVDSREAALEKPKTLEMSLETPPEVARIHGFRELTDAALAAFHEREGFAMSLDDLLFVRRYFTETEQRD